jgi:hypothetical protein
VFPFLAFVAGTVLHYGAGGAHSQVSSGQAAPPLVGVSPLERVPATPVTDTPVSSPPAALFPSRWPGDVEQKPVAQSPPGAEPRAVTAPAAPNGIILMSPPDRYRLAPGQAPVVIVEGEVEDWSATTVWLVANDRRIPVRVVDGHFRQALPLLETALLLWAESRTADGRLLQWSRAVTVHAASRHPSGAVLMLAWPGEAAVARADVRVMWRQRPERVNAPLQRVPLRAFGAVPDGGLPEILYLSELPPGVYTFLLRYEAPGKIGSVRPTLHLSVAGRLTSRELNAFSLSGVGTAALARVLLPQMVHWDQDGWFTGRSASGDTVTKFRLPEGITWIERTADLK